MYKIKEPAMITLFILGLDIFINLQVIRQKKKINNYNNHLSEHTSNEQVMITWFIICIHVHLA